MLNGSCHCGAVVFACDHAPDFAVACNCSICRRLGAVWVHAATAKVRFERGVGATLAYLRGDKAIAFHSCATCGATTHWANVADPKGTMAVNIRLCDPADVAELKIRPFDGAETWRFLDAEPPASK